jgi:hypothetical protein
MMRKVLLAAVLVVIVGCAKDNEAPQVQTAQVQVAPNASAYDSYLQEAKDLASVGLKKQQFGKFEVAKADFFAFADAKHKLEQRAATDATLSAEQKSQVEQAIQDSSARSGNFDQAANAINMKLDDFYSAFGCNSLKDKDFQQAYIAAKGMEAFSKIVGACPDAAKGHLPGTQTDQANQETEIRDRDRRRAEVQLLRNQIILIERQKQSLIQRGAQGRSQVEFDYQVRTLDNSIADRQRQIDKIQTH